MLNIIGRARLGFVLLGLGACGLSLESESFAPFVNIAAFERDAVIRQEWLQASGLQIEKLREGLYVAENAMDAKIPVLKVSFNKKQMWGKIYRVISVGTAARRSIDGKDYLDFSASAHETNLIHDFEIYLGGSGGTLVGNLNIRLAADHSRVPMVREYWRAVADHTNPHTDYSSVVMADDHLTETHYRESTPLEVEALFENQLSELIEHTQALTPPGQILKTRSECEMLSGLDCSRWIR